MHNNTDECKKENERTKSMKKRKKKRKKTVFSSVTRMFYPFLSLSNIYIYIHSFTLFVDDDRKGERRERKKEK